MNNLDWRDINNNINVLIKIGDSRYEYIMQKLINPTFPSLISEDKSTLAYGTTTLINFTYIKFYLYSHKGGDIIFWNQLTQNNMLDLRAFLNMTLPFIDDTPEATKKNKLGSLYELYIAKDSNGKYIYTNSQYNRCIRYYSNNNVLYQERPYLTEYYEHNIRLLLMSIEMTANKLYVNWLDVTPVTMTDYKTMTLYTDSIDKISTKYDSINEINVYDFYIDAQNGLSINDMYNVIANHLYHEIVTYRWVIYDLIINNRPVEYLTYLQQKFDFKPLWKSKSWTQLTDTERDNFINNWQKFVNSDDNNDNIILSKIYYFFTVYYPQASRLLKEGKLKKIGVFSPDDVDDVKDTAVTDTLRGAKIGIKDVPYEDIYTYVHTQIDKFKKTWFYYALNIRENYIIAENDNFKITPKFFYNYAKSLIHDFDKYNANQDDVEDDAKYLMTFPAQWHSLPTEMAETVVYRLFDIPNSKYVGWFNINRLIQRFYPDLDTSKLRQYNREIHDLIRSKLVDVIFESLIYHGTLTRFMPNRDITDMSFLESKLNTTNIFKITTHIKKTIKDVYLTPVKRADYEKNAYYYLTNTSYGDLIPQIVGDTTYKYFDFLTTIPSWMTTYAMNWVSQINFYNHYINCRVLYVTGSTGAGKSTQVPVLLMYCHKMIDYILNGKIICTVPRIPPAVENAEEISTNLGVQINNKYGPTSNYYIQYKHSAGNHMDQNTEAYLRLVTDGTLLEEMKRSPFLTRKPLADNVTGENGVKMDWIKQYQSGNIYDTVIVDEAHEHNANMDVILTLARDSIYINNKIKLLIISATMDDDEPIYRRYYRRINDNRAFPLSSHIEMNFLDRCNVDRRIHISQGTRYPIQTVWLSKEESDKINSSNFLQYSIDKTLEVIQTTNDGGLLLFLTGRKEIDVAVSEINSRSAKNIICLGYYGELSDADKKILKAIHTTPSIYTRYKEDVFLDEKEVTRRVSRGTYTRAVLIATNVAEASITLSNLKYVIDPGYAKTKIFNPVTGMESIPILPISWSSAVQRTGRVGRVAPGVVYALYNKEKIVNNKTSYKISDDDSSQVLLSLIKEHILDASIISRINDINNIQNIMMFVQAKYNSRTVKNMFGNILKNPRVYADILRKQYMYMPLTEMPSMVYTYFGKSDLLKYTYPLSNIDSYASENHDDYSYQGMSYVTNNGIYDLCSRCHTGYDSYTLEDTSLQFHIIHPDENVIYRNQYTGYFDALQYKPSIDASYYDIILAANNINVNNKNLIIGKKNIVFPKYITAIQKAKIQSFVSTISSDRINIQHLKYDLPLSAQQLIDSYLMYARIGLLRLGNIHIKTRFFKIVNDFRRMHDFSFFDNILNMLWYMFSIPYGISDDILGIILLINKLGDIKKLQKINDPMYMKNNVSNFIETNGSNKGDIYFYWTIWESIKTVLHKSSITSITTISAQFEAEFIEKKRIFLEYVHKGLKISGLNTADHKLFLKLFNSNKLNVINEYYYYVENLYVDFKTKLKNTNISHILGHISNMYGIVDDVLQDFILEYLNTLFKKNKNEWLYKYQIEHGLLEEDVAFNVLEWINTHLNFPRYFENDLSNWGLVLETYLRAYYINLIKNNGTYYVSMLNASTIPFNFWSKRILFERTFLTDKSEYMVYHKIEVNNDTPSLILLTPTNLKMINKLNPLYFFLHPFTRMPKKLNEISTIIQKIVSRSSKADLNTLKEYINRMMDPLYSNYEINEIIDSYMSMEPKKLIF